MEMSASRVHYVRQGIKLFPLGLPDQNLSLHFRRLIDFSVKSMAVQVKYPGRWQIECQI